MIRALSPITLAGVLLLAPFLVPPAAAQVIVLDPKSVAQAIKQVAQGVQEIQTLQAQLQAQASMLQHLGSNPTASLQQINQQALGLLQQSQGIGYASTNVSSNLASAYPTSVQGQSLGQLTTLLNAWNAASRQVMQEGMQTQNQIVKSQSTTSSAVAGAVDASGGAPGQTAAIQATNQLLSALSTQLSQLQNLLITQGRQTEILALQQQAVTAKAQSDSAAGLVHTQPTPQFTADSL